MKRIICLVLTLALLCMFVGCGEETSSSTTEPTAPSTTEADAGGKIECTGIYRGVAGRGVVEKADVLAEEFRGYQFEIDGEIKEYGIILTDGWTIQNTLERDKEYRLVIEDDMVLDAKSIEDNRQLFEPLIKATPGEQTIINLLKTAVMPLGNTLYVYGGGWNFQNETSSYMTMTIGVPQQWKDFFDSKDADYNYKFVPGTDNTEEDPVQSYYDYGKFVEYFYPGVDCSGYMGWLLFNVFNTQSSTDFADGYVGKSTTMAQTLSDEYHYGDYEHEISKLLPGDIISIKGHVYMVVGTCDDGSIVIIHSNIAPSRTGEKGGGVQLSALNPNDTGKDCDAYKLADSYIKKTYPQWYERYEITLMDYAHYMDTSGNESCGRFSWNVVDGPMSDSEGIRDMSAAEILKLIFGE